MIGYNTNAYNGAYPPAGAGTEAAIIDAKKLFVIQEDGLWYAFVVTLGNWLACYRSSNNFDDPTWIPDKNFWYISGHVDDSQLSAYTHFGSLYVVAINNGEDVLFKSEDRGQTWTQAVV